MIKCKQQKKKREKSNALHLGRRFAEYIEQIRSECLKQVKPIAALCCTHFASSAKESRFTSMQIRIDAYRNGNCIFFATLYI